MVTRLRFRLCYSDTSAYNTDKKLHFIRTNQYIQYRFPTGLLALISLSSVGRVSEK